jgi:NADH:ubiquinone oxidoreductase subunit H
MIKNIHKYIYIYSYDLIFDVIIDIVSTIIVIIGLLIAIAFYTLAERKIMGGVQRRQGPHTVGSLEIGISGFLQPVGDGLKLIIKEIIIPSRANVQLFLMAPMLLLTLSLTV